jgi:hypothetical protein
MCVLIFVREGLTMTTPRHLAMDLAHSTVSIPVRGRDALLQARE